MFNFGVNISYLMKKMIMSFALLIFPVMVLASTPLEVVTTNMTDQSIDIAFYTSAISSTTINYGTTTTSMTLFSGDSLSNGTTHYHSITGLTTMTTYYFQIISNGVTDNNGGNYYRFTTFPANGNPPNKYWTGNVFQIGGTPTANGAIILFQIDNGGSLSSTASYVNTNAGYLIDQTQLRDSAGNLFSVAAGTMRVRILGGAMGELTTSFAVAAAPPVQNQNFTLQANTQGPVLSQHNPTPNATGVAVNASVFFRITDNDVAVSQNSIHVDIEGVNAIVAGVGVGDFAGSAIATDGSGGFFVTINHVTAFPYNTMIDVSVNARDVSNNIGTANYSFTTTSGDITGPVVTALSPTSGQTNVAIATDVSMNINDLASGVSLNTIRVTLNTTLVFSNGAAQDVVNYPLSIVASGNGYNLNINPTTDFANSATITLQVSARDISGNITNTSYSFTTIAAGPVDTTPPTTNSHSPVRAATGVSANGSIVVHVVDTGVGVSQNTIVMTVSGNTVSPVITGTAADYTLTYAFNNYTAGATINVTVAASDVSGNAMTLDSYYFVIYSAPVVVTTNYIAPYPISVPTIFDPGVAQTTTLMWPLSETKEVVMKIYDLNGQSILQRRFTAGTLGATAGINNTWVWDGRDDLGRLQATGIYYFYLIGMEAGQQKVIGRGNIIIRRTK
jgi:hypothetical protein